MEEHHQNVFFLFSKAAVSHCELVVGSSFVEWERMDCWMAKAWFVAIGVDQSLDIFGVHSWGLPNLHPIPCHGMMRQYPSMTVVQHGSAIVQVRVKVQHLADAAAKMSPKCARFRLAGQLCGYRIVRSFPGTKMFFKNDCVKKVAKGDINHHIWGDDGLYPQCILKNATASVICTACERVVKMHLKVLVVPVALMETLP